MKTLPIEQGQRFSFRLADVICPEQEQAISSVTPELEVTGKVVFLSDSGDQAQRFAVLDVAGVYSPLIVPVERLKPKTDAKTAVRHSDLHEPAARRE